MDRLHVLFLTTSAVSDGVRRAGTNHVLPEYEAERLIEAGITVRLSGKEDEWEIPSEAPQLQTRDHLCEPPGGMTLAQAMKELGDPYKFQHMNALVGEASKDRVWGEICHAFARNMQAGDKFAALGRPGSPEASYEAFPAEAWATLRPLEQDGDDLQDGDHTWYAVRIYDREIVDEWLYLKSLHARRPAGLTLVEALDSLAGAGNIDELWTVRGKRGTTGPFDMDEESAWALAARGRRKHFTALDKRHQELFRERFEFGDWVFWGYLAGNNDPNAPLHSVPARKTGMLVIDHEAGTVQGEHFSLVGVRVYPRGVDPNSGCALPPEDELASQDKVPDEKVKTQNDDNRRIVPKRGVPKQSTIAGWKADHDLLKRIMDKSKVGVIAAAKIAYVPESGRSAAAIQRGRRHYLNHLKQQKRLKSGKTK